ncbi:MAG TPA: L,D-transpeptidase family protein [Candidatus Binatia bacterium]
MRLVPRTCAQGAARLLLAAAIWLGASAAAEASETAPQSGLAPLISQMLLDPQPLVLEGARLDSKVLRALYDTRGSAPLWVEQPDADARIDAVLSVLRAADREGLEPQAYRIAQIERRRGSTDPIARAELDLLLSEAVMLYGVHVRTGARRPRVDIPDVPPAVVDPDPVRIALDVAGTPTDGIPALMAELPPQTNAYRAMRDLLARYREIAASGGWPRVPDGPKLTLGVVDPSVRALRARLRVTGDLTEPDPPGKSNVYDATVQEAVRRFQRRHGLVVDGTVGPRTRAALNVPASARVQQIVANMERMRWLPEDLGERYVRINIPEYRLELAEQGETKLEMPVIVGRTNWQTPVFSSEIRDIVFNPPWNVPPRIASEELFPRSLADESYFASQSITVRAGGRLRQAPGPKNPLGRLKFNLPNPYGVYLHDTPNKDKFRLGTRSLSHGCVRLQDAKALAAALLEDTPEWNEERRKRALSTWTTRTARLRAPVPVHFTYATAWATPDGEAEFREDIYGIDGKLAKEIARPRGVRLPEPTAPVLVARDTVASGLTSGARP